MQAAKPNALNRCCGVIILTPCLKLYPEGFLLIYVCRMRFSFLVLGSFPWCPVDASKWKLSFFNPFFFSGRIAFCNFFFFVVKKIQKERRKSSRRTLVGDCSPAVPEDNSCNWLLKVPLSSFSPQIEIDFSVQHFPLGARELNQLID